MPLVTKPGVGRSYPLGPRFVREGVNFSIYSKYATSLELVLFDNPLDPVPARVIPLTPDRHRTYHYWHVYVPGLRKGQAYGWRAAGPSNPSQGLRFDPQKLLIDPYGRAIAVPERYDRGALARPGDTTAVAMRSVIADPRDYDWEGDNPLRRPWSDTVLYEMHVGGFTRHPSSGLPPGLRGTYAGMIAKIPHLVRLGVTAVELLPIFHFDDQDAPEGRRNYWGYCPVSFFAPHAGYASEPGPLAVLDEFRDLVKALHRAGIEVILDVVFNHTSEGDQRGPTFCYRGLANEAYYILENDRRYYTNISGTGNTMKSNHTVVRRLVLDSLRYWVESMHVDGFRFDLASILSRDEDGHPLENPPLIWDIESDPTLAGVKMIAEAWDPGGLYQVGRFVGDSWKEWNGRFRDDVRSFVRGDPGKSSALANRLLGSPDLYGSEERETEQSVNFVTCHDGFTLNDLVSYDGKHNEANGEGNRDGNDDNLSWNCGEEGPSGNDAVNRLRERQMKNFHVLNLLSMGAPMILMGDEVGRTQSGNNNAYSQDNETSWLDWNLVDRRQSLLRFVTQLVHHRRGLASLRGATGNTLNEQLRNANLTWHGVRVGAPDWSDASRSLAWTVEPDGGRLRIHTMVNAYWETLSFELPAPHPEGWLRWIDTALDAPDDISPVLGATRVTGNSYLVTARSIVVVFSRSA